MKIKVASLIISIILVGIWTIYSIKIADEAKDIEKKIDRLFTKSRKQAVKKVIAEYDHLPYKEKRAMESELLKDIFGDNLLDFVNVKNKQTNTNLFCK